MDPLLSAGNISVSGLNAQSQRMRVISENLANVNSTGKTAGSDPYRRKTISFQAAVDHGTGNRGVGLTKIATDKSSFIYKYEPGNPAANEKGYVKYPNVNMIVEMADMREANRSYEANLQVVRQTRDLISQTISLLK
ncbi:flagellar basal body rod protein FlgC [Bartonella sp. TP]|uniref:flagellar basal body rod protein FlgC n=1 Tax=Bartonella sp. TP TaxID=3057550 RepID=UPI0025AFEE29|nr:flagellar basal body rod protein FlgC [Bartonella sp. TP]MDN5249057.1 flagellar basal body rod protein FlgC [Alphaproteobacteria bacterium]WJW80275.1 flagellar basal body rod protein FlgC [Bartonella sp. TP]